MRASAARAALRLVKLARQSSRRAGIGLNDSAETRQKAAPALVIVAREVLDQVGEDRGAAGAMKEDHFYHRETAAHQNLVDVRRPERIGRVAQVGVEDDILSPLSQPGGAKRRASG